MKEAIFIRQNMAKWHNYEREFMNMKSLSPDYLAEAYGELSSDLAFAQTHYPNSTITTYLNSITAQLHQQIYGSKRESASRLLTFWTRELPLAMWQARRAMFLSLALFLVAVAIGAFSAYQDPDFVRVALGDSYVDQSIENVENGEPMGIYGSDNEYTMYFAITLNNIKVGFYAFAAGLLTSVATGYVLFNNGIILGAWLVFFFRYGLLSLSLTTIMLHGTLELSAIVIAGGAGIVMGNGWLFPGTYSRLESFKRSAKRGAKIVLGTVPMFMVAGFIESFITRHVEWPLWVRASIIGVSALVVFFYYVYYPWRVGRHAAKSTP